MNDTTWFWQIVDARGLADVSSEETVALREILDRSHRAEAEIEMLREALKPFAKAAEDCGVEDDLRIGVVKPADVIWESAVAVSITYAHVEGARSALENSKGPLADATSKSPDPDLSSLRKGAEVMREALRKIAFLRPAGPTRNKLAMQMERIAIDALGGPGEAARSALVSGSREEQT